jgi:hypothetical protein
MPEDDVKVNSSANDNRKQGAKASAGERQKKQKAADFVLVLDTGEMGPVLTKTIWRNKAGQLKKRSYDDASRFDMRHVAVSDLEELAAVLDGLGPHQAIVCGALVPELGNRGKDARRLLYPDGEKDPATIQATPHYWVIMDIDGLPCPDGLDPVQEPEKAAHHIIAQLPEPFHGAGFRWQLTSSAGLKPGINMRLTFWMDRALTGEDLKAWLAPVTGIGGGKKLIDPAIYTANQVIYCAPPILEGVEDPVPQRSGVCAGGLVRVPELRPSANPEAPGEKWGTKAAGLSSYRQWRAAIGDHIGGQGFFEPIKHAVGCWFAANPTAEDAEDLRADLEAAIRGADRDKSLHPAAYIEERVRDLPKLIEKIAKREREKPAPRWVEQLNEKFAVALYGSKAVIADTRDRPITFLGVRAFFEAHANKTVPSFDGKKQPLAEAWFHHPRRREYLSPGVVFEPAAEPKERPGALNLWQGFAVEPVKGDWHLMQAHIRDVLCAGNETHAAYVLDWMAYGVQHPEVQAEAALCFTGAQGCGKGVVWRAYGRLFDPHFRHFNDPEQITGKFNADLGQCVFTFLDEALWGGDRKSGQKLKTIITDDALQIERKTIDRIQVPNRLSIVTATNEDWGVPIEIGDRRWAAFKCDERYSYKNCTAAEREAYFDPLYAEMENGGLAAMLYDLLRRPVTANAIRRVPNTDEKARLKALNFNSFDKFFWDVLQAGELPEHYAADTEDVESEPWTNPVFLTDKSSLMERYLAHWRTHKRDLVPLAPNAFFRKLKEVFKEAVDLEYRVRLRSGKLGGRQVKFASLVLCREMFDKHVGNDPAGGHWDPAPLTGSEREYHRAGKTNGADPKATSEPHEFGDNQKWSRETEEGPGPDEYVH